MDTDELPSVLIYCRHANFTIPVKKARFWRKLDSHIVQGAGSVHTRYPRFALLFFKV